MPRSRTACCKTRDIADRLLVALLSWCLAPLFAAGVDDLTAGRIVLVAAGSSISAPCMGRLPISYGRHAAQSEDHRRRDDRRGAASRNWATCLLDPDLLADALLFCYFWLTLDPSCRKGPCAACWRGHCRNDLPGQGLYAALHAPAPGGDVLAALVDRASRRASHRNGLPGWAKMWACSSWTSGYRRPWIAS